MLKNRKIQETTEKQHSKESMSTLSYFAKLHLNIHYLTKVKPIASTNFKFKSITFVRNDFKIEI